jgi:hypothetical protein
VNFFLSRYRREYHLLSFPSVFHHLMDEEVKSYIW